MSVREPIFAALDLGTNNCRMLIAQPEGGKLRVLESFSRVVRLGEGVAETGMLSEDAMQRTREALAICAEKLRRHPIAATRFVATEACRKAANAMAFLEEMEQTLGLDIQIISSKDESIFAFLGCAPLLLPDAEYAVLVDVGGGSTECILIHVKDRKQPKIRQWCSMPLGLMGLTEQHGHYGAMVEESLRCFQAEEATQEIASLMISPRTQLLCASGVITTLGAIHQGLPFYDRHQVDGMRLPRTALQGVIRRLTSLSEAELQAVPCVGADRAQFLPAGCAILDAMLQLWPSDQLTIADRGVREGILFSLYKKHNESQTAMREVD
jgi:exopolyphosphatase/guanosine-5'-triphosphate,3'-diphosphate pyrophosphatase